MRNHGVGALFEAQDLSGTGRVALREIPLEAMGELAVNALGRLPHHPVLPNVVGSGRDGDNAWVALEFPAGKLLSAVGRALDPLSWARVGSAVASALAAAHESDVVHGELSNDSVLICGERVLLYDLPLVVANRLTDRRSEARLLAQLPYLISYLSPERIRGDEPSPASDVYALGVLLCIAGGSEPAPGETALERIHRVSTLAWRPTLPMHLGPQHALLNRMLAADPSKRPAMREVATELSMLLDQITIPPASRVVVTEPNRAADPFEALIANGVTATGPDPHAIPTRQGVPGQGELSPAPTAPARGQALAAAAAQKAAPAPQRKSPPPAAARKSPPKAVPPQQTAAAPTQTSMPSLAPVPLPTEPARAAAPTPGKRKTPVPPMVDPLNDTGKLWKLDPIPQVIQHPAVVRLGPPPSVAAPAPAPVAPVAPPAPAAAALVPPPVMRASPQHTMPFGYSEITYKQGVIIDQVGHQALEQLPLISGELVELPPMNEAQQLTEALAAPAEPVKLAEAYINPESFDETDEVEPSPVVESDEELAAALKPAWKRASVILPLAAVLVMGIAGVAVWQFAPDVIPSSFELPKGLPSISSLMPSSSGSEGADEETPRRRRTVRPASMPTTPAAPVQAEAEVKAEEPKAEPPAVEAKEEPKAEPKLVAEAKPEPVKTEEPAKVTPPAQKQVAKARPAPAPAPAQKKVAAAQTKGEDTPAIDAKPKGAPSKLGDDDP